MTGDSGVVQRRQKLYQTAEKKNGKGTHKHITLVIVPFNRARLMTGVKGIRLRSHSTVGVDGPAAIFSHARRQAHAIHRETSLLLMLVLGVSIPLVLTQVHHSREKTFVLGLRTFGNVAEGRLGGHGMPPKLKPSRKELPDDWIRACLIPSCDDERPCEQSREGSHGRTKQEILMLTPSKTVGSRMCPRFLDSKKLTSSSDREMLGDNSTTCCSVNKQMATTGMDLRMSLHALAV